MRNRIAVLSVVLALVGYQYARAADEPVNETTLQGNLLCGHCSLKQGDKCNDVLVVKEGDKDVQYKVILTDATKDQHVCKGSKAVAVTGPVTEKDGQKTITANKIEAVKG
jgi:hypothetical protein